MKVAKIDRPINGPAVWHGQELARSTGWIRPLAAAAIAEIDAALREIQRRGLDWREVRKKDFPLPGFSAELAQVNRDLEWGPVGGAAEQPAPARGLRGALGERQGRRGARRHRAASRVGSLLISPRSVLVRANS